MKKLIALILALLLLGSAAACAETAPVLDLKDPVLELTMDGETAQIDLAGLTLRLGAVGEGDEAVFALNILGGDELLFSAAARLDGGRVLIAADGFSHSYAADMPAASSSGGAGDSGMSALGAELMQKLMAEAEINMTDEAITFRLPYTAVNSLLRELLPLMDKIPNADELVQSLDEMEANGEGFELSGSLSMNGGFHADIAVTPVSGGEPGETAFRLLFDLETLEDGGDFYLTALAPASGSEPVFRLEGSFRTAEQGFRLHVDVYASAEAVSDGTRSAVLDLTAGEGFSFRLELPGVFSLELGYTPADKLFLLAVETEGFGARLTGTVAKGEEELQVCSFPAEVVALEGMSEEQSGELMQELTAALAPLLNFVMPALASSGVMG